MKELVSVIEQKGAVKFWNGDVQVVDTYGPVTLAQHERYLAYERGQELTQQLPTEPLPIQEPLTFEELSKWKPSGAPRLTKDEVYTQVLGEICPEIAFNLSAPKLDSDEYKTIELYRTEKGGRLSLVEIEARRLRQTNRASVRVSTTVMGEPNLSLSGKLALVDTSNNYRKKVRLSKGGATFHKMKSGEYTMDYLNTNNESFAEVDEDLDDIDEVPVLMREGTIFQAPAFSVPVPRIDVRGGIRALGQAATQTIFFWRP